MDKTTPRTIIESRRTFLKQAASLGLIAISPNLQAQKSQLTPKKLATSYNNYYEFSDNKKAVAQLARDFTMQPWSLTISGMVKNPFSLSVDKLPSPSRMVRRFRCVEGWSMVVPWNGFSLSLLLQQAQPLPHAKYVKFTSVLRPSEMIGQRRDTLSWPYTEGLRLDEAMHPLAIVATGMYDQPLPAQNGGPLRLVVPWKYGYKSIKAITQVELVAEQPLTTWSKAAPSEYGFYANVNPRVKHPRWNQRRELPLGQLKKVKTLMFNGYEKEVAHLYQGMDLAEYF